MPLNHKHEGNNNNNINALIMNSHDSSSKNELNNNQVGLHGGLSVDGGRQREGVLPTLGLFHLRPTSIRDLPWWRQFQSSDHRPGIDPLPFNTHTHTTHNITRTRTPHNHTTTIIASKRRVNAFAKCVCVCVCVCVVTKMCCVVCVCEVSALSQLFGQRTSSGVRTLALSS